MMSKFTASSLNSTHVNQDLTAYLRSSFLVLSSTISSTRSASSSEISRIALLGAESPYKECYCSLFDELYAEADLLMPGLPVFREELSESRPLPGLRHLLLGRAGLGARVAPAGVAGIEPDERVRDGREDVRGRFRCRRRGRRGRTRRVP